MNSTICVAEDRKSCEPCLKLLLLSLTRYWPAKAVALFYPPAGTEFLDWLKRCPQVRFHTTPLPSGHGWNIKPIAMLRLLDNGYDEVVWLDSDILVTRDPSKLFASLDQETMLATEDALGPHHKDPGALRARLWGLVVGRVLPFGLNTGVLRVTLKHHFVLRRWWELLQLDSYRGCQQKDWDKRPIHMLGDQDVLTALLTSQEFAHIPLRILRRGSQIVQFDGIFGYTVSARLRNMLGDGPNFVHQFGHKPWSDPWHPCHSVSEYMKKIYLDLSPHTLSALQYRDMMDCNSKWMNAHYVPSRILRSLTKRSRAMAGLPFAVAADVVLALKTIFLRPKRVLDARVEFGSAGRISA